MRGAGAAAAAVHHHKHHGLHRKGSKFMGDKMHDLYADDGTNGLSRDAQQREKAARAIQSAALKRVIGGGVSLDRKSLLARIMLEQKLRNGLLSLLLTFTLLSLVVYSAILESDGPSRIGLMSTLESVFSLDDSLAEIKTLEDLKGYMKTISSQSRVLQPLSTEYFSEHDGEVKIFNGFSSFAKPQAFDLMDLKARVDTTEWTMTAWVKLESEGGAIVVRKPLGKSKEESRLSCWSWYVGWPYDEFEFGAHDFGGGKYVTHVKHTITSQNRSVVDDNQLHYVAIVVMKNKIQFWVDAELSFETSLPRPVTDCKGTAIEIGSPDIPSLGEVIFYPHKMTQLHFKEIMFAGFTLEAINEGKVPYVPEQMVSDIIIQKTDKEFSDAHSERLAGEKGLKIESTLSRTVTSLTASPAVTSTDKKIVVVPKTTCPSIPIFKSAGHDDTSCHLIDVWDALETDPLNTGRSFYNMLPAMARPLGAAAKDPLVIDHSTHLAPKKYLRYDATTWNSFCGTSATFSVWLETNTVHGGALLSRYSAVDSHDHSELEYALYAEGYALLVTGRKAPSKHKLPTMLGSPLEKMKHRSRRHVAYVFNHTSDETLTYLDGTLVGSTKHAAGTISQLDCDLSDNTAYTGLGHLAPGIWGLKGPIQDWRYYKGHALTSAEIYKIAEDKTGSATRTCEHHSEGGDSTWTDIYGHDCAWYYAQRQKVAGVCADAEAQRQCPEACGVKKPCHEAHPHDMTYQLWSRIMLFEDSMHHKGMGLLCPRSGVDLVGLCKKNARRGASSGATVSTLVGHPPGAQTKAIPATGAYDKSYMDINVRDCTVLEKVVNSYCAWGTARTDRRGGTASTGVTADVTAASTTTFGREVHKVVKANGGYTIEFWVKIGATTRIPVNNEDYKAESTSMRRIVFFSKVSPPQVMATLELRTDFNDIEYSAYGNCEPAHVAVASVDCPKEDPIQAGVWQKISMVYGATNKYDKKGIKVMRGSQLSFQFMDGLDWCETDDDFIQAIQLPGGVIISPIEITLKPLAIKELQERYYHTKPLVQVRHGPAVVDKKRKTGTISYNRQPYNYPLALMAPPIVLQARTTKTPNCSTVAGTDFTQTLWNHTVHGEKCHFPYDCSDGLSVDSTELMTCKTDKEPTKFFGAHKLGAELGHMGGLFFEFLQTMSEAHVLLRIDHRRRGLYLGDLSAEEIRGPLTRIASRRKASGGGGGGSATAGGGTASAVAGGSSSVKKGTSTTSQGAVLPEAWFPNQYLDFETEKVEVLLATFSPQYGIASLITITAQISSEVELDYSIDHYQAIEGARLQEYYVIAALAILLSLLILIGKIWLVCTSEIYREGLTKFETFNVICLVVLPIVWFVTRSVQLGWSGYLVDHTVGHYGLAGIPWQEQDVLLEDKISQFLSLLHHFEDEIDLEKSMSSFYFVVGFLLIFRLILDTELHPRTAMLVKTMKIGLDDMLHFILLFVLITCAYVILGMAQFGHFRTEFQNFDSAFRTLWDMQLGAMLESGEVASSKWSAHPILWWYQMSYMIIVFFSLFNFIIAIIVEAYMQVKNEVEDDDTDGAIWEDVWGCLHYAVQSMLLKYPAQEHIIHTLELSKKQTIGYETVRQLFPAWRDRKSLNSWLEYYARFEFLSPDHKKDGDEDDISNFQNWLHTEMSVMLGVPKPTEYERILESKRLDIMGFRKRIKDRMESRQIPEIEDPNSSFVARRARKERRLLSMPIPPSAIFKDTSHLRPQPVEASMDTVPAWVEEVIGAQLAASMLPKMKGLGIDGHVLRFLDHDGWKKLGVEDTIARSRLLSRQHQEADIPTFASTSTNKFDPAATNVVAFSQSIDAVLEDIENEASDLVSDTALNNALLPGQVGGAPRGD